MFSQKQWDRVQRFIIRKSGIDKALLLLPSAKAVPGRPLDCLFPCGPTLFPQLPAMTALRRENLPAGGLSIIP